MTEVSKAIVSVVVPAFNESANVPGLLARFREFRQLHPHYSFQFIVVDDGSTDGTFDDILAETGPDLLLTAVKLSRNFGSHYAISAGLEYASGDCSIVLGADLQEPATLLGQFLGEWERGSDVVWGVRQSRVNRTWASGLFSRCFSFLLTRYADLENYPPEGPSGVLLTRPVVRELLKMRERNRNILALIAWLGFKQTRISYDQVARRYGATGWTRAKMMKLAIDSFVQFSAIPLRACSYMGLIVAALGLMYALLLVGRSLAGIETPSGWPTLTVIVLLLGGIQLTVAGVMGEYLWRAVEEVRGRPLFVVSQVQSNTSLAGETGRDTP